MLFRFQEIKKKDKVAAMQFLQTSVSELIDHSNMEQTREVSQICYKTNHQKLRLFLFYTFIQIYSHIFVHIIS